MCKYFVIYICKTDHQIIRFAKRSVSGHIPKKVIFAFLAFNKAEPGDLSTVDSISCGRLDYSRFAFRVFPLKAFTAF